MYIVKINETTKTPHLFNDETDLGEMKLVHCKKDKCGYSYRLPDNELGRQWLKGHLAYDSYEITERAERRPAERKNWQKYLTDDEREVLEGFELKAKERMAEAKKPLTEEEKLMKKIEKLQAQLNTLKGNN